MWPLLGVRCSNWNFQTTNPSDGGTTVSISSSGSSFRDFFWFDCAKVAAYSDTSFMEFNSRTGGGDFGGNVYQGLIPGNDAGKTTSIDYGIVVRQERNSIEGVRGFNRRNVLRVGHIRLNVRFNGYLGASYLTGSGVEHTVGNQFGYCKIEDQERGHEVLKFASSTLPLAGADYHGQMRLVVGGAGVADRLHMCMRKADGTYVWAAVADPNNPHPT